MGDPLTSFRISCRGYRPYGKRDWIAAIKAIHNKGGSVFAGDLEHKGSYLYDQGIWLFGDWDRALSAAGFDPERMRKHNFWDRERVVKEIRRLRSRHLTLSANHVMKNHADVFSGALRQYGAWNKAVVAAGVTKKGLPSRTRLGLLRALRDAVESKSGVSEALRLELVYYFGSLRKAKVALKTDARLRSGWSKRKIVALLTQRHRSKQTLAYATGRREFPALVSAAEAYFGSWGKALNAAGIDPSLYFVHNRWRNPSAPAPLKRA